MDAICTRRNHYLLRRTGCERAYSSSGVVNERTPPSSFLVWRIVLRCPIPNGKPGDDPLTDMFIHGEHPFPADMEAMLRQIRALDPLFPNGDRSHADRVAWWRRIGDWARKLNLDEGREALRAVLNGPTR